VELVEALGSELLVHFTIDATRVRAEGETDEVEEQLVGSGPGVARVDPRMRLKPGERVRFGVDVARMHFFDPASGRSILDGAESRATVTQATPSDVGGAV
jgi:multiple sugar transport system ATP-binding protein